MHIECEKGSSPPHGTDRPRARRPSRRGSPAGQSHPGASSHPEERNGKPGSSAHAGRSAPGEVLTLEHVLAAAKRRRAPVSVETAGYIALGVADALVAAPAIVQPAHVQVTPEGDVLLRGAVGRGDEQAAEQGVRSLLARLLSVAVGASPALVSAAHRSSAHGLDAMIEEIEAALVPVNRAAARRTIGRLAREVARAGIRLPEKRRLADSRSAAPPTNGKRPKPTEPMPAPLVEPIEPVEPLEFEPALAAEKSPPPEPATHSRELAFEDATDVDAPVAPVVRAPTMGAWVSAAPCVEACGAPAGLVQEAAPQSDEDVWLSSIDDRGPTLEARDSAAPLEAKDAAAAEADFPEDAFEWEGDIVLHASDPTPPPRLVSRESLRDGVSRTPQLTTYDPRDASVVEETFAQDELESEVEEDDLLTYEPPEASGDEAFDFGTASPPEVGLAFAQDEGAVEVVASSEAEAPPEPAVLAPIEAEAPSELVGEDVASRQGEASNLGGEVEQEALEARAEGREAPEAAPNPARPDRVGELLAGFGVPSRSSREVAGELKSMLGLPLTPAPPPGSYQAVAPGEGPTAPREPASEPPPAPVRFTPPRNPKVSVAIATGLLALALAILIALYVLFPALLIRQ